MGKRPKMYQLGTPPRPLLLN